MATALDTSHNLASERSSIESTYELTKYLEYQLKEIKDIYVSIKIQQGTKALSSSMQMFLIAPVLHKFKCIYCVLNFMKKRRNTA